MGFKYSKLEILKSDFQLHMDTCSSLRHKFAPLFPHEPLTRNLLILH